MSGIVVVDGLSSSGCVVCGVLVSGVGCVVGVVVSAGRVEEDTRTVVSGTLG